MSVTVNWGVLPQCEVGSKQDGVGRHVSFMLAL